MGPLRFDGGRVCLDLVGTRAGRPVVEGLPSAGRLREWVYGAGLVPDGAPVGVTEGWLAAFKELRARLDRMVGVELKAGAQAPEDVAALNEAARPAPPPPVAEISPGGGLRRGLHGAPSCAGLLAAVARDAVDLFTDPAACARLTRCAGENCTLVYLDTSRGKRRRWCSSEVCGNRERVARHRRRAAPGAARR
ncbi:CGNR zinc finger domain-containing protein [Streptomyces sp. NBC_01190]|uniref:CGNR zinc finger domain-containing protein n=1 Tax=Streptomyces sp. NBC_01190 TaxID=2903767 RepID=UPI0038650B7F|nr:ABATE domain-containing protein [Streptomyces sp. NBC_01190]